MTQKIKVGSASKVMNVPVSELSQVLQHDLGPDTEAIVTRNKETVGVLMSVARRNALADAEQKLHAAMLYIDMMAAGRSMVAIDQSAEQVRNRQGSTAEEFLAELLGEVT